MNAKPPSGGPASVLLQDARDLRSQLASRDAQTKLTILPGDAPGSGDDDVSAVGFVIVITGHTAEAAFNHAESLRKDLGCNCVSSGETEITCACPD